MLNTGVLSCHRLVSVFTRRGDGENAGDRGE
jgi:hypothetical protein